MVVVVGWIIGRFESIGWAAIVVVSIVWCSNLITYLLQEGCYGEAFLAIVGSVAEFMLGWKIGGIAGIGGGAFSMGIVGYGIGTVFMLLGDVHRAACLGLLGGICGLIMSWIADRVANVGSGTVALSVAMFCFSHQFNLTFLNGSLLETAVLIPLGCVVGLLVGRKLEGVAGTVGAVTAAVGFTLAVAIVSFLGCILGAVVVSPVFSGISGGMVERRYCWYWRCRCYNNCFQYWPHNTVYISVLE